MAKSKVPYIGETERSEYRSRTVRKIDNGFLTMETHDKGGIYTSSEKFSEKHPDEETGKISPDNSLAMAVNKLKGR